MPPLQQPSCLLKLCYTNVAFSFAKAILEQMHEQKQLHQLSQFAHSLPSSVLASLYFYVVECCRGHTFLGCALGENDKDVLNRYCDYLAAVIHVLLHSDIKVVFQFVEHDFVIDMRTFQNFNFDAALTLDQDDGEEKAAAACGTAVIDELLQQVPSVLGVGEGFASFAKVASENLSVFDPGLYLLDRSLSETVERKRISLCWTNAQVIINIVDRCKNLNVLNLDGYQERDSPIPK